MRPPTRARRGIVAPPNLGKRGHMVDNTGRPGYVECHCGAWVKVRIDGTLYTHRQPSGMQYENRAPCFHTYPPE